MPSNDDHLHILGLARGVTWREINEAYRDLISVWHPDRFQHNERLRIKAEEQTRAINAAMDELRKSYKEGDSPPLRSSSSPRSPSSTRPGPVQSKFSARNDQYRRQHQRDVRNAAYHFELAPLIVYQRPRASFTRLVGAALIVVVAYLISQEPFAPAERVSAASVVLLSALHIATLNAMFLFARRPALVVSSYGLASLQTGFLRTRDISRMWSCIEAGNPSLAVQYSRDYLKGQHSLRRVISSMREVVGRAHCVIPCGSLDTHPAVIINRLTVQHLESPSGETSSPSPRAKMIIRWGVTFSLCIAAALCARPLIGLLVTPFHMAFYCGLFLVTDLAVMICRFSAVKQ